MPRSFEVQVREAFGEICRRRALQVIAGPAPKHFDNTYVDLVGPGLFIQVVQERTVVRIEIRKAQSDAESYDLELCLRLIGGSEDRAVAASYNASLRALARILDRHYEELLHRFSDSLYRTTASELLKLKRERARELFG